MTIAPSRHRLSLKSIKRFITTRARMIAAARAKIERGVEGATTIAPLVARLSDPAWDSSREPGARGETRMETLG